MRRNALLLVAVMLVQVALPMQAGAATSATNRTGRLDHLQAAKQRTEQQQSGFGSR